MRFAPVHSVMKVTPLYVFSRVECISLMKTRVWVEYLLMMLMIDQVMWKHTLSCTVK